MIVWKKHKINDRFHKVPFLSDQTNQIEYAMEINGKSCKLCICVVIQVNQTFLYFWWRYCLLLDDLTVVD